MGTDSPDRTPALVLGRPVGDAHPPFVIAALDCTKLGSVEGAIAAVDSAATAHCDAVKLTSLPWRWCARMVHHADTRGVQLITTVSDERSIERLDGFGTSAFEIFFDWADLDLVACAARTGRPLVLSVANASATELSEVVALARREGASGIALVQRVLDAGLDYLDVLRRHNTVVGISDRSVGPGMVGAAIRRGARIVEKRITSPTLSADLSGVVGDCERAWAMLGHARTGWTTN